MPILKRKSSTVVSTSSWHHVMSLSYYPCVQWSNGFFAYCTFFNDFLQSSYLFAIFFTMSVYNSSWHQVTLKLLFIEATIHMYTWFCLYTRFEKYKKWFNLNYRGLYTVWICRDHIWLGNKILKFVCPY